MEYTVQLNSLIKLFRQYMNDDKDVTRFYARCRDGTATYKDVYDLADKAGVKMSDLLKKQILDQFPNGIPPEAVDAIIQPALREQCDAVIAGADRVQALVNKKAGIGIAPAEMHPDEDRILGLAEHFKESGFTNEAAELITNLSKATVDETIRTNAEFQNDSGMKVTVTRVYDDVGLNHGKDPCQWCLDRCGENVPYSTAVDMGMFERHPGCGCRIEYHTAKGSKIQSNWRHNVWMDSDAILKFRRGLGLE
jgi:hypothetical protein